MIDPDLGGPLNSRGGYGNASGEFDVTKKLSRRGTASLSWVEDDDAIRRNFGSFSVESKRHVWDLLQKHPKFQDERRVRKNRIINNTREVLTNDPIKLPQNGGFLQFLTEGNNDDKLAEP